jgi:hypothetical protein
MSESDEPKNEFHISVYPASIYCRIDLPFKLNGVEETMVLENKIHESLEEALLDFQENFLTNKI